jgi:type I restriction enzyme M protein
VFKETFNRMLSGYLLRDVVNVVDRVDFTSSDDIHTIAHVYESMLREMRDAAGDSGEFYTPRPVIRFIVQQVDPSLGELVLDPAAGTGGFLVEVLEHLRPAAGTAQQWRRLQADLRGVEKKPLPYLLGMMNLLLHDVEQPNLRRDNALASPITQIGSSARVDVVVTTRPSVAKRKRASRPTSRLLTARRRRRCCSCSSSSAPSSPVVAVAWSCRTACSSVTA